MAVIIGSARIDENGNISGGSNRNNASIEVSTQEWYLHSKGWYVLRAKDSAVAEKIAKNMQYACDSKYIGYDQSQNNTLYNAVKPLGYDISKLNTYCETDCARLVRVCVLYAGVQVVDFYTGNLKSALLNTGKFTLFTGSDYCRSSKKLKRGDILVTRTKGHVVVVLSDGSDIKAPAVSAKNKLVVDGLWGQATTRRLQEIFGTPMDGIISNQDEKFKTENPGLLESTFEWQTKPNGNGSQLMKALQKWAGMSASDRDGEIGPKTISALQKKLGTVVDGYASNPSDMVRALQTWANKQ